MQKHMDVVPWARPQAPKASDAVNIPCMRAGRAGMVKRRENEIIPPWFLYFGTELRVDIGFCPFTL